MSLSDLLFGAAALFALATILVSGVLYLLEIDSYAWSNLALNSAVGSWVTFCGALVVTGTSG